MNQHLEGMLKPGSLDGKVILVTGGGTGLGRAMTKYFLELGARCVIASRKLDVLEVAARELEAETGGQVLAVPCDVRQYDQIEDALAATLDRFGRLDGLVNNAAGNFISPTERLSHRAFDIIVDIVLRGTYYWSLCAGKHWIEQKQPGNILSILTTYAYTGSAFVVPSATAKGGALALTRSLAAEWAKYKIRLNAIAPGPFPTKGAWDRLVPPELEKLADPVHKVPMGRYGEHQELANLAAYLISDYSAYMTGEIVTLDGGAWHYGAGQFTGLDQVPYEMWEEIEKQVRKANKP